MPNRPTINLKAVASTYASGPERIAEFGNGDRSQSAHKGGLLALRNHEDGTLHLSVYRTDPGVLVSVSTDDDSDPYLSVLREITRAMLAVRNDNPQATSADYITAIRTATD